MLWASNLEFTVERSTKTLVGSTVSGEGLVNVDRGTGRVLMCPVAPTTSLFEFTNTMAAKAALNPAIHLKNHRQTIFYYSLTVILKFAIYTSFTAIDRRVNFFL